MTQPKKVTALGGIFMKCADPAGTREWYAKHLGFNTDEYGTTFEWRHAEDANKKGYSVWSTFKEDSKYFAPSEKDYMINLRVADLEWLLGELKKEGVEQVGELQVYEYGKFAHIIDPNGVKIELWEAVDETYGDVAGEGVTK